MHGKHRNKGAGFTLVEVLVVLAIVALVSAIAIPGLARLGAFSRDEFKRTVTHVDSVLRAAQIYATTYHVDTAVVYTLDNWSIAQATSGIPELTADPVVDTVINGPVRQFEAAAVMYNNNGIYVPVPGDLGNFEPFPEGMAIMLQNPEAVAGGVFNEVYYYDAAANYVTGASANCIGDMGLNEVNVQLAQPNPAKFPAHVFRSGGRMSVADACGRDKERFTIYIAPSADRPLTERLVEPDLASLLDSGIPPKPNLQFRKIYLFKSTARITVPASY